MSLESQQLVAARRQVLFGATALIATSLLPVSSLLAQRQAGRCLQRRRQQANLFAGRRLARPGCSFRRGEPVLE